MWFLMVIIGIGVCFLVYSIVVEPHKLCVKHITIPAEVPVEMTLVQFTDTHFTPRFIAYMGKLLTKEIANIHPDLILFSGDLIDHYECYPQIKDGVIAQLKSMNATYGKYAVYGNHDIGGGAKSVYADIMKAGGFQLLCNQVAELPEVDTAIFGIDDCVAGYEDITIVEQTRQPFQILISHEPDVCERMKLDTIQLMVSGHTHGGQVALPVLRNKILPKGGRKYRKGIYHFPHTTLVVSSGIGTTKLPMRFSNTPELIVYHVQPNHRKK